MMRRGREIAAMIRALAPGWVLMLTLALILPLPLLAQDGAGLTGAGGWQGKDTPGEAARGYDDIMDDVNAVIDAMRDAAPERGSAEAGPGERAGGARAGDGGSGRMAASPRAEASGAPALGTPRGLAPEDITPNAPQPQGPAQHSPVVVELFTAQGCAACPPADDLLADLARGGDVLALSWNVDYWDYLGWPDPFARPAFSKRQKGYNVAAGSRMLFTPQIIVGGQRAINLPRPADLMEAVKAERAEPDHVAIDTRSTGPRREIALTPLGKLPRSIAVRLVRYLPYREVEVGAGENAGRVLGMRNIVAASEVLAMWDGRAVMRMTVTLGAGKAADLPEDTRHAILVQHQQGDLPGEIFAAIPLD
ncbi:DUF1223 domain-containing protein [Paracoccus isoporae]|nr:DUF1223 domain-containing protein [Paracoccus isoporae]